MKSLKIFVILLLISFILFIIFQLEIFRTKEGLVSYEAPPLCEGDPSSQPPPCWATVQKEKYTGRVSEFVSDDFILKTKIVSPVCPNDPYDLSGNETSDISGNTPRLTSLPPSITTSSITPSITTSSITPSITTPSITPSITTPYISPSITTPSITPSITTSSRDISGNVARDISVNAARDTSGNVMRDISGNITNNTYLNTTNNSYYNKETNRYESSSGDNRNLKSNRLEDRRDNRDNIDNRDNRDNSDNRDSDFQYIQTTSTPYPSNELDAPYQESALITSPSPTPTMFYQDNEIITPQKPVIPSPAELKQRSNQSGIPLGNPPWNSSSCLNNNEPVPLVDDFPTQF